jgi:hypothetical protein
VTVGCDGGRLWRWSVVTVVGSAAGTVRLEQARGSMRSTSRRFCDQYLQVFALRTQVSTYCQMLTLCVVRVLSSKAEVRLQVLLKDQQCVCELHCHRYPIQVLVGSRARPSAKCEKWETRLILLWCYCRAGTCSSDNNLPSRQRFVASSRSAFDGSLPGAIHCSVVF